MQAEQKANMLTVVSDAIKHIDKCHNRIKKVLMILKRSAREFTEIPEDLAIANDFCQQTKSYYDQLGSIFTKNLIKIRKRNQWSEKWILRQEEVIDQPKPRKACKFFMRGKCRFGEDCKFSHERRSASRALSERSRGTSHAP